MRLKCDNRILTKDQPKSLLTAAAAAGATTLTVASNTAFSNGDYILYVGQAFPRRHLRETLLAFEKISPQYLDLKFIAIGNDKYNPPIIEKLRAMSPVKLEVTN